MNHDKIHELVLGLDSALVLKVANMCDGHTILAPDELIQAGLPYLLVAQFTERHESGDHYKEQLTGSNGESVTHLDGVYGLDLLKSLADNLGIKYVRKLGRGTQASAIQQALHEHFK